MPKRCANIHKRKDNRWEGRIKVGKYPNGSTKYHSIYGKTYGEVKEKLDALKQSSLKEEKTVNSCPTFGKVLDMWLSSVRVSVKKSTEYRYEYLIKRHIQPDLGGISISDINSVVINNFSDKKLNSGKLKGCGGLSPSYVKSMLNIIKSAIDFAVSENLCMPLKTKISKPTEEKVELPILSSKDQKKFNDYIDNNMDLTGLGMLISLYAGLRIGEVCALSWKDIDLRCGIIHIRHTVSRIKCDSNLEGSNSRLILDSPKTKSSQRDIPISSVLLPYLIDAKRSSVSDFVVSEKKQFLSPRTFEYRYHQVLHKCALDDINYHALRHTFATRCVEAGVDIKSLSEILGHSNVSITLNTYVHSSMELKRMQLEKLTALSA